MFITVDWPASRYSWHRQSKKSVRCGYCRFIFYNRTDSGRTHRWNTNTECGEGHTDVTHLVGYLSPSPICDDCALLCAKKLDMEMSPDNLEDFLTKVSTLWCEPTSSLPLSISHLSPGDFLLWKICFLNSRPIPVNRRCLLHPHFRAHV